MYVELSLDFENPGFKAYTKKEFKELVLKYAATLGVNEAPIIKFHGEDGSIGNYTIGFLDVCDYVESFESKQYMKQFTHNKLSTPVNCGVLSFNTQLLDGQTFVFSQVEDIIIHELAHLVAYRKYKSHCGHDHRWEEIAIGFGGSGDDTLSSGEAFYKVNPIPISDGKTRSSKYYLYCRKCGKPHLETNEPKAFVLFILSCASLGMLLTMSGFDEENNSINTKSDCCDCDYKLIASAEDLVSSIDKGYEEMGWTKENAPSLSETCDILKDILKKH